MRSVIQIFAFTAILCIISCPNHAHCQQKFIGKFNYFGEDRNESGSLLIYKSGNYYQFRFIDENKIEFIDTLIDGSKRKIPKWTKSRDSSEAYGGYLFFKRDGFIYIKYFDSLNRKSVVHKQYPVKKGDTTDYFYLFSGPHYKYPAIEGFASFEKDSTILSSKGGSYDCYIISEHPMEYGLISTRSFRRIFLNKKNFLPVRYEYFNLSSGGKSYYLIDE